MDNIWSKKKKSGVKTPIENVVDVLAENIEDKVEAARIWSMKEVETFRQRFVDSSIDISTLLPPIISEDGTSYAFEWCDSEWNRSIVVNWRMKVKNKIDKINFMFFLKWTNKIVSEFKPDKNFEAEFKGKKIKDPLCCLVGDWIMWPLDALVTYKYNDLGDWTFDVIYINMDMEPKRAIVSGECKEVEDKYLPIDDFTKFWVVFPE